MPVSLQDQFGGYPLADMFDRTGARDDDGIRSGFIQGEAFSFGERGRADQQMRLVADQRPRLFGPFANSDDARSLGDQHRLFKILKQRELAERMLPLIMSG